MNLIEQLGGYEKAIKMSKEWESSIDGDIPLDTMMYSYDFGIFSWGDLQSALLEYRRQHNIFEVGDKVVEISESPETSILKVIHMSEYLMVCENDSLNASYGVLNKKPSFYVRHATQEEIKVGHRL